MNKWYLLIACVSCLQAMKLKFIEDYDEPPVLTCKVCKNEVAQLHNVLNETKKTLQQKEDELQSLQQKSAAVALYQKEMEALVCQQKEELQKKIEEVQTANQVVNVLRKSTFDTINSAQELQKRNKEKDQEIERLVTLVINARMNYANEYLQHGQAKIIIKDQEKKMTNKRKKDDV